MESNRSNSRISAWLQQTSKFNFTAYCITAAFCTYFCMYAFRKPFTAGEFSDVSFMGFGFKIVLVTAQLIGYTLSKFIAIKVISEMPPFRRAMAIFVLILLAEIALLFFAVVPPPYNFVFLFLNGLPLGMVFGIVISFLEGRQLTEALTAGLCASFIVSSGVVKSVGRSLILDYEVSEYWMPFITGLIFLLPLIMGILLLSKIPQPSAEDIDERAERAPMNRSQRIDFYKRHAWGLTGLLLIYVLLTIIRSFRDDFAVEIWNDLGYEDEPDIYAKSETVVMFGVTFINGIAICIHNNKKALLSALGLLLGGFALVLFSIWGHKTSLLMPFTFMVILGLGTYVPYVAFHTTVFERLIAAFRDQGNLGYLICLADAVGYLGYIGVIITKSFLPKDTNFLTLFLNTTLVISAISTLVTLMLFLYYSKTIPDSSSDTDEPETAPEST